MSKVKLYIEEARLPFVTATIVPVVLGASVAWYQLHSFNWFFFILALVGGLFIHAGLNIANDYYDHTSGVDELNKIKTPFSGGSRMIQKKLLTPREVLIESLICFGIGGAIGLYLNWMLPGNTLLWIGVVGIFLAFFYTASPLRIGYTGFGELITAIGFGPVMVLGSYFTQAAKLDGLALFASVPVAIMVALILYINEFPDFDADKAGHKRTLVVILGKRRAVKLYFFLLGLTYVWVLVGIVLRYFPLASLTVLLTLPLCWKAMSIAGRHYNNIKELIPANAMTIGLHLAIGMLLSLSYIIAPFIHS